MGNIILLILSIAPLSAQNEVDLFVDDLTGNCGDTVLIPVQVAQFDSVVSLDFSMDWDEDNLEFTGNIGNLNSGLGLTLFNFGPYPTPDNDTLTFQWFDFLGVSLTDTATLFTLEFIVRG